MTPHRKEKSSAKSAEQKNNSEQNKANTTIRAVLIAGDRSGSGKTSISVAIASALSKKYTVQTFKVGMDYIDPSYLTAATKRPCRNLDNFIMTKEQIHDIFTHACQNANFALIEGVRGLYEGADAISDEGSTAAIAKILRVPVILVVNARSITRSAAALVTGFQAFDPDIQIAGVILNNVQGRRHIQKAAKAIEHFCGVPVLGAVPRTDAPDLTMRHLGLIPYIEAHATDTAISAIDELSSRFLPHIDLDKVDTCARTVSVTPPQNSVFTPCIPSSAAKDPTLTISSRFKTPIRKITIAIAYDEAFNFYYPDLFDIMRMHGAELVFFSPVHDEFVQADGYILGGGYPEYYAASLSQNKTVKEGLRNAAALKTPIYAECGGLMYLASCLEVTEPFQGLTCGDKYLFCDIVPGKISIPVERIVRYVIGKTTPECPFGEHPIYGHAFHYSGITPHGEPCYGMKLERGIGIDGLKDGLVTKQTMAGYTHLHPVPSASFFIEFIARCASR